MQASLMSTEPSPEDVDFYNSLLAQVKEWLELLDGMASRKRARSLSSPSSKPAKHRKVAGVDQNSPVKRGTVEGTKNDANVPGERAMDVDKEDSTLGADKQDAAMGAGDENAAMDTDEEEILMGDDVGGTTELQLPGENQEVWDMPAIQDMVRRYLRTDRKSQAYGRRYLEATLYSNIVEDVQFASDVLRKNK
jgi:hypothetical protein